jgi:hypothetical protein
MMPGAAPLPLAPVLWTAATSVAALEASLDAVNCERGARRGFNHLPSNLPEERQLKLRAVQRTGEESKGDHPRDTSTVTFLCVQSADAGKSRSMNAW